ncbi:adenylyltransferase/cytidyltransferase family protein [Nanoarchaeota archaeon]
MFQVNSIDLYKSEKILNFNNAIDLISQLKSQSKTVGLCHGGFDLVHPGHVKHFESAKKECDILIVSITADQFVTSRKGSGRPIYTDKLRAYMIASLEFVDYVVISDFKKGIEVINNLKPSFYIKGPDFINKQTPGIIAERESIKNVGGEMKYTTEPPMSTTRIVEYIKNEIEDRELLLLIDRDGTLIVNNFNSFFKIRNNNIINEF